MTNKELAEVEVKDLPQPWWQQTELEPSRKLEQAAKYANELKKLIDNNKLYSMIKEKKYVLCEGWTALAGLLGVFANTQYCTRRDDKENIIYDAKVFLQTTDGRTIASAESVCSSKESNWRNRDEYAIKSMAQTRATAKACRLAFSWIMVLAGYEPTPAEEMPSDPGEHQSGPGKKSKKGKNPATVLPATEDQLNALGTLAQNPLLQPFEQYLLNRRIAEPELTASKAATMIEYWTKEAANRETMSAGDPATYEAYLLNFEHTLRNGCPEEYGEFING